MIITIQDYIAQLEDEKLKGTEIAVRLGVSQPMVSIYKCEGGNVNLKNAMHIYANYGICLHPYSEESLIYELNKNNKTIAEDIEDEDTDL